MKWCCYSYFIDEGRETCWILVGLPNLHSRCVLKILLLFIAQLCPALCDPMDCSTPGFPVLHHLQSLLQLISIESVMPSNHLILCCPLILLPLIFPSIKVFSKESVLWIRWRKYWSFSFSISFSNEYSGSTVEPGFEPRRPILENCVLY